jgi:hypothetical protein
MAKKAKWAGRPMRKGARAKAPKVETPPPKPAPQPEPETKDDVLAAMGKLCDEVDAALASADGKRKGLDFHQWQSNEPWRAFAARRQTLSEKLRALLWQAGMDEDEDNEEDDQQEDRPEPSVIIRTALMKKPGDVPSFARPGEFMLWIEFIPIVVNWGGWMAQSQLVAVAPQKPWINQDGTLFMRSALDQEQTVYQVVHDGLRRLTTAVRTDHRNRREFQFKPCSLDREARAEAATRQEVPWVRAALQLGPVDAIPLPAHVKSIQMALA